MPSAVLPHAMPCQIHQRRHGDQLWLSIQGDHLADVYAELARSLEVAGAWLVQERVFSHEDPRSYAALLDARADGVPPTWLRPLNHSHGSALLAHAVVGLRPTPLADAHGPCGRRVARGGQAFATVSAMSVPGGSASDEAAAVFARLNALLAGHGASLVQVARTWLWLDDILAWYGPFNGVRNAAFARAGLVIDAGVRHLPASTGIGATPAQGRLALEALAVLAGPAPVMSEAAGRQRSAFRYGSAFSRAMRVDLLGAAHLFVSGTAAIDAEGRTVAVGDARGQAAHTLAQVRAVLAQHGAGDAQVLQAVVYAATPEAAAAWHSLAPPWPAVLQSAIICRPDLLIEAEVVAALI